MSKPIAVKMQSPNRKAKARVLLIDDHSILRRGLAELINQRINDLDLAAFDRQA